MNNRDLSSVKQVFLAKNGCDAHFVEFLKKSKAEHLKKAPVSALLAIMCAASGIITKQNILDHTSFSEVVTILCAGMAGANTGLAVRSVQQVTRAVKQLRALKS
jgi:hypothetical protein